MDILIEHLGQGLFLILMLSLPSVLTAAGVGLIIGILQAVTQVQEQTLSAAPKIVFVFLIVIFGGGVMMTLLTNYFRSGVNLAFNEIPQGGVRLMEPAYRTEGQRRAHEFFMQQTGQNPSTSISGFKNTTDFSGSRQKATATVQFNSSDESKPQPSVSEDMYLNND